MDGTGDAYVINARWLDAVLRSVLDRTGPYVSRRIARAVLAAHGPVVTWGTTPVGALADVSPDRTNALGLVSREMPVAVLEHGLPFPAEYTSMWWCLLGLGKKRPAETRRTGCVSKRRSVA